MDQKKTTTEHRAKILTMLAAVWEALPDQRLGQIMSNSLTGHTLAQRDRDLYYIEDQALLDRMHGLWVNE